MKRNIWMLNHHAAGSFVNKGGRHYWLAKYLKRAGYNPTIFCCNSVHGAGRLYYADESLWHEHTDEAEGLCAVFVKARTYTKNGIGRILCWVDFYRNVKKAARQYAAQHGKPDVILASSVHPLTLVAGIQLAKYFGVKCICEVRDLWPESIVEYSASLTKRNPLIRLLYAGEKWIYKKADKLIFTMEGGYDYITERGWEKDIPREKVYHINNGVDLEVFDYNKAHYTVDDTDLDDPDTFKVVYTGSIRRVNNLGLLLDAAKRVTDPRIKFLIWGDGDEKAALEQRVRDEGIGNVVFKGRVDKKYVPAIVSRADLNFAHNAPAALFRFGISFNKLFEYLAAGKPVLSDFSCPYNPAVQHHAGISVENPTAANVAAAVERCVAMPKEEYAALCANVCNTAKEYDFRTLTQKLIDVVEGKA